jgi:hypothetical protein
MSWSNDLSTVIAICHEVYILWYNLEHILFSYVIFACHAGTSRWGRRLNASKLIQRPKLGPSTDNFEMAFLRAIIILCTKVLEFCLGRGAASCTGCAWQDFTSVWNLRKRVSHRLGYEKRIRAINWVLMWMTCGYSYRCSYRANTICAESSVHFQLHWIP